MTPKKTWPINKHKKFDENSKDVLEVGPMSKSLGETLMIGFHTWSCMCEGVGRDPGYVMSGLIPCMI